MTDIVSGAFCDVPADWVADFSQCLYEWQGLEAGGFAILAAIIGYRAITKQIQHSKEVESRKANRVFEGRRATLPLVLSDASAYAEEVIRSLAEARQILGRNGNPRLTGNWSPPVFPTDLPNELREFIESSDHGQANQLVLELLKQLQTLRSRLTSLVTEEDVYRIGIRANLAEYQIQASKVRQICGALFPFARAESVELPLELARKDTIHSIEFIDQGAEDDPDFDAMKNIFLRVDSPWWPRE